MDDDHSAATAFGALEEQAAVVRGGCLDISQTLGSLGDSLKLVSTGGSGQEWGGFGLVSLPILASIRAVKGVANQYVKTQTGVSLGDWTDFVSHAGDQFTEYVDLLERIRQLAHDRQRGQDDSPAAVPVARDQLQRDLAELEGARWRTQAWKVGLGRIAQLGSVVDAVLHVENAVEAGESKAGAEEPAQSSGFGGLQRRFKEVQHRTGGSGDLRQWVLHPFHEVRDRAKALPHQVDALAREVGLLELLLDLLEAELRVADGQFGAEDARVVRLRVAASVELPALTRRLARAREALDDIEGWAARLSEALHHGRVSDQVAQVVAADYGARQDAARDLVQSLEAQAAVWRREGEQVVTSCRDWVQFQLSVIDAREAIGERDLPRDRRAMLEREQDRLRHAHELLAALGSPG